MKPGAQPVKSTLFKESLKANQIIRRAMKALIDNGCVKPGQSSPWRCNTFLVSKKLAQSVDATKLTREELEDKTHRAVHDFREINKVIEDDTYTLPRIDQMKDKLRGARVFSQLDCKSGYNQIRVDEDSSRILTVNAGGKILSYTCLAFGVKTAPLLFQRALEKILEDFINCRNPFVVVYVDDILIYSRNESEHINHVKKVMDKLLEVDLQLHIDKCMFGCREITYLGQIFSNNTVKPIPSRVDAIKQMPLPRDRKELRSFLGALNQFQEYIPNYRNIVSPLDKLTSKNEPFEWNPERVKAFEEAKLALSSETILTTFSPDLEHIVETDACDWAIGACLKQVEEENGQRMEKVVEYYSKAFKPAQRNYCTTEKEMLAIILALKKWRSYLALEKFIVRTDHHALCIISRVGKTKETIPDNQRLARWSLNLQDFQFDVVYISGKKHHLADCLSRCSLPKIDLQKLIEQEEKLKLAKEIGLLSVITRSSRELVPESDLPDFSPENNYEGFERLLTEYHDSFEELRQLQMMDPFICRQIELIMGEKESKTRNKKFKLINGVLFHSLKKKLCPQGKVGPQTRNQANIEEGREELESDHLPQISPQLATRVVTLDRFVVPERLILKVLYLCHDSAISGHFGILKTQEKVANQFWWYGVADDVLNYVRSCELCQRRNHKNRKEGLLQAQIFNIPEEEIQPMSIIVMDQIEIPSLKSNNYSRIIIAVDVTTRYLFLKPVKSLNSREVIDLLERIQEDGKIRKIVTDQAPYFTGNLIKQFCQENDIRLCHGVPYYPQTQGLAERCVGTVKRTISKFIQERPKVWLQLLPQITIAYNSAIQASSRYSPFFLKTGRFYHIPRVGETWIPELTPRELINETPEEFRHRMLHYWKDALNNLCEAGEKMISRENKKRIDVRFEVGQKVLQEVAPQDVGPNLKQMKYDNGPFTITQILGPTVYELIDKDKNVFVSNVSQLKRYYLRQEIPRLQMLEEIGIQNEVMDTQLQQNLKESMKKLEKKRTELHPAIGPVASITMRQPRGNNWGMFFPSRVIYSSQVETVQKETLESNDRVNLSSPYLKREREELVGTGISDYHPENKQQKRSEMELEIRNSARRKAALKRANETANEDSFARVTPTCHISRTGPRVIEVVPMAEAPDNGQPPQVGMYKPPEQQEKQFLRQKVLEMNLPVGEVHRSVIKNRIRSLPEVTYRTAPKERSPREPPIVVIKQMIARRMAAREQVVTSELYGILGQELELTDHPTNYLENNVIHINPDVYYGMYLPLKELTDMVHEESRRTKIGMNGETFWNDYPDNPCYTCHDAIAHERCGNGYSVDLQAIVGTNMNMARKRFAREKEAKKHSKNKRYKKYPLFRSNFCMDVDKGFGLLEGDIETGDIKYEKTAVGLYLVDKINDPKDPKDIVLTNDDLYSIDALSTQELVPSLDKSRNFKSNFAQRILLLVSSTRAKRVLEIFKENSNEFSSLYITDIVKYFETRVDLFDSLVDEWVVFTPSRKTAIKVEHEIYDLFANVHDARILARVVKEKVVRKDHSVNYKHVFSGELFMTVHQYLGFAPTVDSFYPFMYTTSRLNIDHAKYDVVDDNYAEGAIQGHIQIGSTGFREYFGRIHVYRSDYDFVGLDGEEEQLLQNFTSEVGIQAHKLAKTIVVSSKTVFAGKLENEGLILEMMKLPFPDLYNSIEVLLPQAGTDQVRIAFAKAMFAAIHHSILGSNMNKPRNTIFKNLMNPLLDIARNRSFFNHIMDSIIFTSSTTPLTRFADTVEQIIKWSTRSPLNHWEKAVNAFWQCNVWSQKMSLQFAVVVLGLLERFISAGVITSTSSNRTFPTQLLNRFTNRTRDVYDRLLGKEINPVQLLDENDLQIRYATQVYGSITKCRVSRDETLDKFLDIFSRVKMSTFGPKDYDIIKSILKAGYLNGRDNSEHDLDWDRLRGMYVKNGQFWTMFRVDSEIQNWQVTHGWLAENPTAVPPREGKKRRYTDVEKFNATGLEFQPRKITRLSTSTVAPSSITVDLTVSDDEEVLIDDEWESLEEFENLEMIQAKNNSIHKAGESSSSSKQ